MTQAVEAPRGGGAQPAAPVAEPDREPTVDQVSVAFTRRLDTPPPAQVGPAMPEVEQAPRPSPKHMVTPSRPADPGEGDGIDVTFVMQSYQSKKEKKLVKYIEVLQRYAETVLPNSTIIPVDGLPQILAELKLTAEIGSRIRRLRIIAHGSRTGGAVLTHIPVGRTTGRMYWIPPKDVEAFAKQKDVRDVMERVLTPPAVVEFWGCHLGENERGGKAWANLFGRKFVAPPGYFTYFAHEIWVRVRHQQGGPAKRSIGEKPGDRHPNGPWIYRQVLNSAAADALGEMAVKDFNDELMTLYRDLSPKGVLPDYSKEPGGELGAMRQLFDMQHGAVIQVGPERGGKDKDRPPITPDEPEWEPAFQPFEPAGDKPVPPAASEEATPLVPPQPPPEAEKKVEPPPAPPTVEKPPSPTARQPEEEPAPSSAPAPPLVEESTPPAPPTSTPAPLAPPAAEGQGTPPAAKEQGTPPAAKEQVAPPAAKEEEAASAADKKEASPPAPSPPGPVAPAVRRLPPVVPRVVSAETVWARSHPEGRVTKVGRDEWLLWNFGVGSAKVRPAHAPAFQQVAAELAVAPGTLQILGLASASGSVTRNVHLSMARAQAVEALLSAFEIHPSLTTVTWSGERPPRADPEAAAHDRAVVVRIPARSRRRPLAPVEEAYDWRTDRPAPPAPKPEPPPFGFTVKRKWKIWKVGKKFPLGVDWILVAEAEAGVQVELLPGASAAVAAAFDGDKWDGEIKIAVSEGIDVKGTLKDAAISVTFNDVPLKPEVKLGLGELLENTGKLTEILKDDPLFMLKLASVKFTLPLLKWAEVDLQKLVPSLVGVPVKVKPNIKVNLSIAPSPVLLGRLGMTLLSRAGALGGAAAPVIVGVVGGAAWTVLALYLINLAHQRGENWAHVVNLRRGYAYRLAAEAADWRGGELRGGGSIDAWDKGRRAVGRSLPVGPKLTDQDKETFKTTYAALYDGWESAGRALDQLTGTQYDELMNRLRQVGGTSYEHLVELIFRRMGGDRDAETPLDISWLSAGQSATNR